MVTTIVYYGEMVNDKRRQYRRNIVYAKIIENKAMVKYPCKPKGK